jgi:PAS domain S-box-containing protein
MPEHGKLEARAAYPAGTSLPEREREGANWAWAQGGAGDAAASKQAGEGWLHMSLGTARGEAAVLSLDLPEAQSVLSSEQFQLLDAMSQQAALAIERCRIDVVLEDKAKTEQVIEASEDGIFVLDGDGRVAHVNDVACTIFGLERSRVLERPFDELGSEQPHYLRVREAARELRAQPDRHAEHIEITVFIRGRDHHYVLRQTPFKVRDGAKPGLILALQDVTYVREQEARRENLVATLSHELRTPLTSLRMAVELLRERATGLPSDLKELVAAVHEDVLRLQDVSQQFLDLARTRAMAIGVQRRRFDMHELVARMLRLFAIQAREKGLTLEVSEDLVPPMMGDETKLSWALSNLIANAIRYTPPGGKVRVQTGKRDQVVLVTVEDSGAGIAAEDQGRIFERYAQGPGGGDAGLGLAIVRDIVQAHGGRIHLESTVGKGTRFTLELPSE